MMIKDIVETLRFAAPYLDEKSERKCIKLADKAEQMQPSPCPCCGEVKREWLPIETAPIPKFDSGNTFQDRYTCLGWPIYGRVAEITYSYTAKGKGRWKTANGISCSPLIFQPLPEPPRVSK